MRPTNRSRYSELSIFFFLSFFLSFLFTFDDVSKYRDNSRSVTVFPFSPIAGSATKDDDVSDFFEKDISPLRLAPSDEEIEGPAGHFVTPGR